MQAVEVVGRTLTMEALNDESDAKDAPERQSQGDFVNLPDRIKVAHVLSPIVAGVASAIVATLLAHHLVGRYQVIESAARAGESEANTELTKLRTRLDERLDEARRILENRDKKLSGDLQEMEKSIKSVRDQLEVTKTRTAVTADLGALLTNLQPNLQIEEVKEVLSSSGSLRISMKLINKGAYAVYVSAPEVVLSPDPINADANRSNFLVNGRDYSVLGSVVIPGYTPPGAVLKQLVEVKLNSQIIRLGHLYYVVAYRAETGIAVRHIVRQYLNEALKSSVPDLDSLAKGRFYMAGLVQPQ